MEDQEKITLSREELNVMLEEAAKRGAREAGNNAGSGDAEDDEALEFIASFEPTGGRSPIGLFAAHALAGGKDKLKKARAKLEAFNDFEERIAPYYDYADDPEEIQGNLDAEELARYTRKHEIYMKLHAEKLRRFGLLGFQRGTMGTSVLDELDRAFSAFGF